MAKQTFQFDIEWLAGDKGFAVDEMAELLENGLGIDHENEITNIKDVSNG